MGHLATQRYDLLHRHPAVESKFQDDVGFYCGFDLECLFMLGWSRGWLTCEIRAGCLVEKSISLASFTAGLGRLSQTRMNNLFHKFILADFQNSFWPLMTLNITNELSTYSIQLLIIIIITHIGIGSPFRNAYFVIDDWGSPSSLLLHQCHWICFVVIHTWYRSSCLWIIN